MTSTSPLMVITIRQPYAELIARGVKRVENRTWSSKYRGPLAIHAGTAFFAMTRPLPPHFRHIVPSI